MEETLTVHRLKLPGLLRQTLSNTNALESANSTCAGIIRRVTHFKNGEVALRQAAAGFMEAERSFRRIRGYREIPVLKSALTNLTRIKRKGKIEVA
jgi:transposase-like protein